MKDTATFRKQGLSLAPSSRDARDIMAKLAEGERVFMQVWKPRNMAQHRKYFAILNNVVCFPTHWYRARNKALFVKSRECGTCSNHIP